VIAMILGSSAVPARYQRRMLFWGILGALVMREAMIGMSSVLVQHFHRDQNAGLRRERGAPGGQYRGALDCSFFPDYTQFPRSEFHGARRKLVVA